MKKSTKITLWVLGALVAFGVLFVTCADVTVSRIAEKKAREAIAKADLPFTVEFGKIHVLLMSGCVDIEDFHFGAKGSAMKAEKIDTVDFRVPRLSFRNISYRAYIKEKKASIGSIVISKACAELKGKGSKMAVEVDSLSVKLKHLCYSLADSTFGYCDSLYHFELHRLQFTNAQGITKIELNDLETKDAGAITLGKTRIWNCVDKRALSKILKEPSTWMDLQLSSVEIAPMNLLRTDFKSGLHLTKVVIKGDKMESLRDNRLQPTKPYPMPQQVLMGIKYPIKIDCVEFDMPKMDVGVLMADKNLGQLELNNIHVVARDFNTKSGNVLKVDLGANLGKGKINGLFKLHNNKECRYDLSLSGKDVETSSLNKLLRPLVAMEVDCHVDSIRASYSGNKEIATGTVMLAYHGLKGRVYKGEDIPIRIVQQNAAAIDYFVNHLIPKSNPRNDSKTPLSFVVEVERDTMKPFAMYMVKPLIMGAVQTFLPGLFQSKKVKEK